MNISKTQFKWLGLLVALVIPTIFSLYRFFGLEINPVLRLIILISLFLSVVFILVYGEKEPLTSLGSLRINLRTLLLSIIILISIYITALLFILVWHKLLRQPNEQEPEFEKVFHYSIWLKLIICLASGIIEETFFRGYGITRLQELTRMKSISVLVPLILFALCHAGYGTVRHVLGALIIGAVLTLFYLKYKNLLANIIAHFLFNFLMLAFVS